jgi:hypothetical protein
MSPLVMIASVTGAPYSEDHEYRRRLRYAVLAGLHRQHFVPRDPEHLGFFWPSAVIRSQIKLPEVVPFEAFRGENGRPALLFWFDEDVLGTSPLQQFDEFCRALKTGLRAPIELRRPVVLGPDSSTTLRAMARDLLQKPWLNEHCKGKRADSGENPKEEDAEFYVFSATAADTAIIPAELYSNIKDKSCSMTKAGDCLSEFFVEKNVNLYRMTTTDVELTRAMRDELAKRWPRRVRHWLLDEAKRRLPGEIWNNLDRLLQALGFVDDSNEHHVVLISEWDTLYGSVATPGHAGLPRSGTAWRSLQQARRRIRS